MFTRQNKILRVGIVGSGGMSEVHIAALSKIKGFIPIGVFSNHQERLRYISDKFKLKVASSYNALINECDVIDITSKNNRHIDYAEEALRLGRHIIMEKPVDVDLLKAEDFLRKADASPVEVTVISQNRYNENIRHFINDRNNNRLGDIFYVHTSLMWRRGEDYYRANLGWRGRAGESGGGVVIHQGIHLLDLLLWLFGDINIVHSINKILLPSAEVESLSTSCLEFSNGILATLSFSTNACANYPFEIDVYGTKGTARIIGTDGYEFVNSGTPKEHEIINKILRKAGLKYRHLFSRRFKEGSIQDQLKIFYSDIINDTREAPGIEDGIKALRLAYRILHV